MTSKVPSDILNTVRPYVAGLKIDATVFKLPSLEDVREDAWKIPYIEDVDSCPPFTDFRLQNHLTKEIIVNPSRPMIYDALLPALFRFSVFAAPPDVPEDLHESVLWALKMSLKQWEEGTESELQMLYAKYGMQAQDEKSQAIIQANFKHLSIRNARAKVGALLLVEFNKPLESAEYFRLVVESDMRVMSKPWLGIPETYALYGEALVCSGIDDKRAQKMLELSLEAPSALNCATSLIRARVFLSRVLRRLDKADLAIKHESFATKWLRDNPRHFPERKLRALLIPEGEEDDPILKALGGAEWIYNADLTAKELHTAVKACHNCRMLPIQKQLRKCSRCKFTYYCSPACQKADWKSHKDSCDDAARMLSQIERLKQVDPEAAKMGELWKKWTSEPFHNNVTIHALGLHRDPKRGLTHILFQAVEYTPNASTELRHKFRVAYCSVYRIADILVDLERIMGLDAGEGEEYINGIIQNKTQRGGWPMLHFVIGNKLAGWLLGSSVTANILKDTPYNPHWRRLMNIGEPPKLWNLRPGLHDQELIF